MLVYLLRSPPFPSCDVLFARLTHKCSQDSELVQERSLSTASGSRVTPKLPPTIKDFWGAVLRNRPFAYATGAKALFHFSQPTLRRRSTERLFGVHTRHVRVTLEMSQRLGG